MKKATLVASMVGAVALTACVWAQVPGPGSQGPGGPPVRDQMRQRMQQRMGGQFQGGPGMQGQMPGRGAPGMPGRGGPGGPDGIDKGEVLKRILGNPELARKAGVTDEQIAKIKEGEFAFEKQMIQLRADAEQSKLEVRHLMQGDKPDRTAISKAIDNAALKEVAMRKAGIMRMLDVQETLGRETIEKMKGMVRDHMQQRIRQSQQGGPGAIQRPGSMQRPGVTPGGPRPMQQRGPGNQPPATPAPGA